MKADTPQGNFEMLSHSVKKNYAKRGYTESLKSLKKEKKEKTRISGKKRQETAKKGKKLREMA